MDYVCGYLYLQFKDGHEFCQINPSQALMNLHHVHMLQYLFIYYLFFIYLFIYQPPKMERHTE